MASPDSLRFPEIKPFDYQTAVQLTLARLDSGEVETVRKKPPPDPGVTF